METEDIEENETVINFRARRTVSTSCRMHLEIPLCGIVRRTDSQSRAHIRGFTPILIGVRTAQMQPSRLWKVVSNAVIKLFAPKSVNYFEFSQLSPLEDNIRSWWLGSIPVI